MKGENPHKTQAQPLAQIIFAMKKKDSFLKSTFVTQTHGYIDIFPRRELWEQVNKEFKGKLKISLIKTYEIEIHRMTLIYKNWELLISESDTKPLKFEIKFQSQIDFDLIIGQEDSVEKFLKFFGNKEIEISNPEFDEKYLIKSNNVNLTRRILSSEVVETLLKFNFYSFAYTTERTNQTSNLIAVISRHIDSKSELIGLINLFFRIIDKFEENKIIK